MFNFIFSSDWRWISLAIIVLHFIFAISIDKSKDNCDKRDVDSWFGLMIAYILVWAIIPMLSPIVIFVDTLMCGVVNQLGESIIGSISSINDNMKKASKVNKDESTTTKEQTEEAKKKEDNRQTIVGGLTIFLDTLRKKELIFDDSNHKHYGFDPSAKYLKFGYIETIKLYSNTNKKALEIINNLEMIVSTVYSKANNDDYKAIHGKLNNIAIASIEFFNSIVSDEFMDIWKMQELCRAFYDDASQILAELVSKETKKIKERKEEEERKRKEHEQKMAKFSYDKFNGVKEDMINTISTIANVKIKKEEPVDERDIGKPTRRSI